MSEKHTNIREDKAADINPKEVGVTPSAKDLKAQQKPDIKQSEIGREISQTPADEPSEPRMSQIDDETVALQKKQLDDDNSKTKES